jgi:hypothetical protein
MTRPTTTPPADEPIPNWAVRPDRGTQTSPPPPPWGAGLPTPGEAHPVPQWVRATWIIWCAFWALFWITAGWLVLPFVNVLLAGASIALVYAVEPNRPWTRTPTVIVVNNPPPPAQ